MNHRFITATGRLRIEPPLTWNEIKDSPYRPELARQEPDVLLEVETTEIDGPDGVMLLHRAPAARPYDPGSPFGYHGDLLTTVQSLIDEHGHAHTFTGFIECREVRDYAPGEWWRIVVRDGRAVRIDPQITWPDEENN